MLSSGNYIANEWVFFPGPTGTPDGWSNKEQSSSKLLQCPAKSSSEILGLNAKHRGKKCRALKQESYLQTRRPQYIPWFNMGDKLEVPGKLRKVCDSMVFKIVVFFYSSWNYYKNKAWWQQCTFGINKLTSSIQRFVKMFPASLNAKCQALHQQNLIESPILVSRLSHLRGGFPPPQHSYAI